MPCSRPRNWIWSTMIPKSNIRAIPEQNAHIPEKQYKSRIPVRIKGAHLWHFSIAFSKNLKICFIALPMQNAYLKYALLFDLSLWKRLKLHLKSGLRGFATQRKNYRRCPRQPVWTGLPGLASLSNLPDFFFGLQNLKRPNLKCFQHLPGAPNI